jgi:hypothetical protein
MPTPTLEIIPTPLVNIAFKEEFDWKTVIGMLWSDDILKVCSKKDVRGKQLWFENERKQMI